jgi:hypothetical protein
MLLILLGMQTDSDPSKSPSLAAERAVAPRAHPKDLPIDQPVSRDFARSSRSPCGPYQGSEALFAARLSTTLSIHGRRAFWGTLPPVDALQIPGKGIDLIRRKWCPERVAHLVDFAGPLILRERRLTQHHICRVTDQALAIGDVRAVTRREGSVVRRHSHADLRPPWRRTRGRLFSGGGRISDARPGQANRKRES